MNYTFEKIEESIGDNLSNRLITYRIYDEYKNSFKKNAVNKYSLIGIKSSYEQISKKLEKNLLDDCYLENYNIKEDIDIKYLKLIDLIYSFDVNDKSKIKKTLCLITYLECLLKIPVTFPGFLEETLSNQLNINELANKENLDGRNIKKNTINNKR